MLSCLIRLLSFLLVTLYKVISTVLVEGILFINIRYFPAAPVQLSTTIGSSVTNGGAEAWIELQKALNIVGDYRLQSSSNALRWAIPPGYDVVTTTDPNSPTALYPEHDYAYSVVAYTATGAPIYAPLEKAGAVAATTNVSASSGGAGNTGSGVFAMATDLETSNGVEISGLNAEEQVTINAKLLV